jgi:hypothetical protein
VTSALRLTARDLTLLAFMAEHQQVIERQVIALVGGSPDGVRRRLSRLTKTGYVARNRQLTEACYTIGDLGLAAVGSDLRRPEPTPRSFRHDVGTAGLWLAAWNGAFGPVAAVIGERRMRSHDEAAGRAQELYAVRLGGYTDKGRERRHYPDLLLIDRHGRRMALELELTAKETKRREEIVGGYGADRRLDGVIYLVENDPRGQRIGRAISGSAALMGLSDRVHVRRVRSLAPDPAPDRAAYRARSRPGLDAGR